MVLMQPIAPNPNILVASVQSNNKRKFLDTFIRTSCAYVYRTRPLTVDFEAKTSRELVMTVSGRTMMYQSSAVASYMLERVGPTTGGAGK